MRLPIVGPVGLLRLPGQTLGALQATAALLPRVLRLVGDLEMLVRELRVVVRDLHATQKQADAELVAVRSTRGRADAVVDEVVTVVTAAGGMVDEVALLVTETSALASGFRPAVTKLAPMVHQLAASVETGDVAAVLRLIRSTPEVLDRVQTDVLPVLNSLDTVGPNLEEVVAVSAELSEMVGSVPGMGKVKKRIQKEQQHVDGQLRQPSGG